MAKDTGGTAVSGVAMTRGQSALEREKELSELRADVARRQAENKPERPMRPFRIQAPGREELVIRGWDANDAWARYCDKIKHWPSPKVRIVQPA